MQDMKRRGVIGIAAGVAGAVAAGSVPAVADAARAHRHGGRTALVYRGPAASEGCPEAVAALLSGALPGWKVAYCGPKEKTPLSRSGLAGAALYAQPGGGDLDPAWKVMRGHAGDIRDFVRGGGYYLGFCLGGYLAGRNPGFGLLPGDADEYVGSPGADVTTRSDTVIALTWRGRQRHLYFQDGALFRSNTGTVLARYRSGAIAALVAGSGKGRVGVVGPHPEADETWYRDAGLTNPDGVRFDLGHDLVTATVGH